MLMCDADNPVPLVVFTVSSFTCQKVYIVLDKNHHTTYLFTHAQTIRMTPSLSVKIVKSVL
jgi:hypothetical protein